ncbi:CotH kinase family protein [Acholeplasma laidlawii]|uniref:CotH kinase family protein n=1 Tax=Acholeplasma laidlawii TaxID=2148 RepID=UPI00084C1EB9|nr:CotH kinase family protein [Acholeplasma laidlawii]OED59522.1 hypothetical protein BHS12_03320 [Acholeplasma laidlawii]
MKKTFLFVLSIILCIFVVGCTPKTEDVPDKEEDDDIVSLDTKMDYVKNTSGLYDEFFDVNSNVQIKIDIAESELALIQSDYETYASKGSKSPIYRMSNVTFIINGKTHVFEEVGIRMKGNTSRTNFYNQEQGLYHLIHYKLSFKQTFDDEAYYANPKVWASKEARDERKDRTFAGMEKLDVKWNKSFDETYSREYWTYEMYSSYGVLAPKITPVNIQLKYRQDYENLGVYFALECIDELFLEKRLGSKHLGGDLYKVGWDYEKGGSLTMDTINKIGVENEDESYFPVYDLKTNKKNNEHILLKTLIQTLNQDTDFSSLVNMNYYLVYEAISYLVGNPDDLRHHYNNYYIYFLKDTNQAIFIPYDFDRTFGVTRDWNPSGDGMTSYSPYAKMTTMGGVDDQINPLVLKTVVKGAPEAYLENYKKVILEAMSTKFYKDEMFNEVYQIRKEIYDNAVSITISDMGYFECLFNYNETKNMKFSSYLSGKTTTINQTIND